MNRNAITPRFGTAPFPSGGWRIAGIAVALVWTCCSAAGAWAQSPPAGPQDAIIVDGLVKDSDGAPVAGVSVFFEEKARAASVEAKTKADGSFVFLTLRPGEYSVRAVKAGQPEAAKISFTLSPKENKHIDLVLAASPDARASSSSAAKSPAQPAMEFADRPDFTVAGVTDWSNVGGHGSDANLRTSEALARETVALRVDAAPLAGSSASSKATDEARLRAALARSPETFEANRDLGEFCLRWQSFAEAIAPLQAAHRIRPKDFDAAYDLALAYNGAGDFAKAREQAKKALAISDRAAAHRLLGDLDESLNDPLSAVREYETAARLEPSEQNEFAWGTELLLHRAVQPAVEVFTGGARAHPDSARMLAGYGAALYAKGAYADAARKLCEASDLNPADPAPYLFLGQMEKNASDPLPCAREKLERLAREQPGNSMANYYYAIALWKGARGSANAAALQQAQTLLEKSVSANPKLAEGYLQLGIVNAERGDLNVAIRSYKLAIEINPDLGEAHYRLGLAYKRTGDDAKAQQEFQLYKQIDKNETAAIERQRRELRRFMIILKDQPAAAAPVKESPQR